MKQSSESSQITTFKSWGLLSVLAMAVLSGCASKPTHNQTPQAPKIIINAQGVPSYHLVQRGDTVSQIARRYQLGLHDIGRLNNLDSQYTIYAGQWLMLWQSDDKQTRYTHQPATTPTTPTTTVRQPTTPTPMPTPAPVVTIPTPVSKPVPATTPVQVNQPTMSPPTTTQTPAQTPAPSPTPALVGSVGLMQFVYPVSKNNPVVRRFGNATVNGNMVNSHGMWFSGRDGDAVMASRAGTVIHADGNMDGAMIAIEHADGFVSNYFHIKDAQVKAGQNVQAGQRIASMKQQASGNILLEFRISKNSRYIDPISVLK